MTPAQEEWARCSKWLAASLKRSGGFYGIDDCAQMVESGLLQFWPLERSAGLTEIIPYPNGKALNAFVTGGDIKELREKYEPMLVRFARDMGCRWIMGGGRPGWVRATKTAGYRLLSCTLIKDL